MMHERCKHCTLKGKPVPGVGPMNAKMVLIGEAPGVTEEEKGIPFVGRAGKLLREKMEEAGIPIDEVYITNVNLCRPPGNREPTIEEINTCKGFLEDTLEQIKPKVVVPLGNVALYAIEGTKSGITARSGIPKDMGRCWSVPAIHPSWFLRHGGQYAAKLVDALRIAYSFAYGEKKMVDPKYVLINNMKIFNEFIERIYDGNIEHMGFDIETRNLDLFTEVLGVGFSPVPYEGYYIPIKVPKGLARKKISSNGKAEIHTEVMDFWGAKQNEILKMIGDILKDGDFGFCTFNGLFDILRLRMQYGDLLDFRSNWMFDVYFAAYLLDENRPKGQRNLGSFLSRYGDIIGYKKETKGINDFTKIPTTILAARCMRDCDGTLREANRMAPLLKEQELEFMMYDYMMETASELLVDMMETGCFIDQNHMNLLDKELRTNIYNLDSDIIKIAGRNFNPASGDQLANVLFDELNIGEPIKFTGKLKRPSVDADHLEHFVNAHPIVPLILKRNDLGKMQSTYVDGWRACIEKDGRIHTNFNLAYGTVTGRISSSEPNLQNPDRRKEVRRMISAPPSKALAVADVSQSEIRWLANESGDEGLLQAYAEHRDIHCSNLCLCLGWDYNDIYDRYKAGDEDIYKLRTAMKNSVSFGRIYGMGDKALVHSLMGKLGIDKQEATKLVNKIGALWVKTFPKVETLRRNVHRILSETGIIRHAYGQLRRLPEAMSTIEIEQAEAFRQGFNYTIQGPSGIMTLLYMMYAWKKMRNLFEFGKVRPILTIHDSMTFEADYDILLDVGDIMLDVVKEPPLPDFKVPIEIDLDYDKPWTTPIIAHLTDEQTEMPLCGIEDEEAYILKNTDPRVPNRNWCKDCLNGIMAA